MSTEFDFERLVELCQRTHEETRHSAARAIDRSLVARNWLIGLFFVEFEQSGVDRAEYGARLLARVADRFRQAGIKGASATRLKLFRQFYRQRRTIGPTLSDQLTLPAFAAAVGRIRPTTPRPATFTRSRPPTTTGASANSGARLTPPCISGSHSAATSKRSQGWPARVRWSKSHRT